jgi:hypothetical protein
VTDSADDSSRGTGKCGDCGATLTGGQRYCLHCGARNGPLPESVANRLPAMARKQRGAEDDPAAEGSGKETAATVAATGAADAAEAKKYKELAEWMPPPRVAALLVLGMLGLGVLLGSVTSHLAQSAGLSSIIVETGSSPKEEPVAEEEAPEELEEFAEATEEPPAEVSSTSEEPESTEEAPLEEPVQPPPPLEPPPEEEGLPPITHVYVIALGESGYEETYGPESTATYLAKELTTQGELIPNYFAVAGSDLANQVALLSGQGPTPQTLTNCPEYTDIPAGVADGEKQVTGEGCVYPKEVESLPSAMTAKKLTWKAYVEDSGSGVAAGQPATCRHSSIGSADPNHLALPGDPYRTWRNPFMYFHALTDSPECEKADVGLEQLAPDLAKKGAKAPALSYIVPSACHDGGPEACEEGKPVGPAASEEFLRTVVPAITASAAYKEGGLIAILSTQAPQVVPEGKTPDTSACCLIPVYPNVPPPPAEATPAVGAVKTVGGGGKVGLLLISPYVKPGTTDETDYVNHFSLLATVEELFELEKLGYTANPAVLGFNEAVFNASEEEVAAAQSKRIKSAVSRPSPTPPKVSVRRGQGAGSKNLPSLSARATAAR